MEHYFTNNKSLKSELRTIEYRYKDQIFTFNSDNGVFSKNKIDFGSKCLIETLLEHESNLITSILDVGCGYGFMGIVLAKVKNAQVTLTDINKRAVHLAQMNIKENKIKGIAIESYIYENINGSYDLIVTNPPIRAGKETVLEILKKAKNYLKSQGSLWFVIRKDQGAKSILKEIETFYENEIIKKEKGFFVIRSKKR